MSRNHRGRQHTQAPPGYITVPEAAEVLGVSAQTVRNRINNKSLPGKIAPLLSGARRYYVERKAVQEGLTGSSGVSVDELAASLDTMREQQEELERSVREILVAVRNETPMAHSDKQVSANDGTGREKSREWRIAYERADDPEFQDLVGRDVRGNSTPEEHALLRAAQNVQLWRDGLRAILSDLQTQFAERKATAEKFRTECFRKGESGKKEWFDYKAELDAWRGGALRFKRSVELQLAEAKRLSQEHQQQDEKERFRQLLVESLGFLNEDEAITYKFTPNRDTLREKISGALYKSR
jgi:excisionase family DNA binding protein